MILSEKEQTVAIISNGIAAFSLYSERGELPKNITMFDFILRSVPENLKPELTIELIDAVFDFISKTHS